MGEIMGNLVDNKFTWVIKNFLFLQSVKIYSDEFVIDGCKWRVLAYPKGNGGKQYLSLYLVVSGSEFLPVGWRRNAKFYISVVNQLSEPYSLAKETQHCFDASTSDWGFTSMISLNELHEKNGGYLVNGELKIVVQVSVLEVIGAKDVTEKSAKKFKALIKREENEALRKREENDVVESNNLLKEASSVKECVDVNGFRVLPSQVESVRCIFKRHPNIASEFRPKNQHLRSAYMNVLLSLISTMCQSTLELSNDDLTDAYATLAYLTAAGLNLKWLEEKLDEVSKKKEMEENGEKRIKGIEQELKEMKQKRSDLKAELEKEIADVYVARAPLTFDDVV